MSQAREVTPIRQRHLWEQIADELRGEILSGVLQPGARLVTADLAQRWGVSRGPVREALMALENEGIVVSTRRHGTVVGNTSVVDLEEILSVREAIETFAAVDLCGETEVSQADLRRLADLLARMEREWAEGQFEAARDHDYAFHQLIVDLAGNSRFSTVYRQMISQTRHHSRAIDPQLWPLVGWEKMRVIHRSLLDAVVSGDPEAVRSAVADHYLEARWRVAQPPPSQLPGS
jgi:GntR family transcriptional regulator of gluconate operon